MRYVVNTKSPPPAPPFRLRCKGGLEGIIGARKPGLQNKRNTVFSKSTITRLANTTPNTRQISRRRRSGWKRFSDNSCMTASFPAEITLTLSPCQRTAHRCVAPLVFQESHIFTLSASPAARPRPIPVRRACRLWSVWSRGLRRPRHNRSFSTRCR